MSSTEIYDSICKTVELERSQGKDCALVIMNYYAEVEIPTEKLIKETVDTQNQESKGVLILKDGTQIPYECQNFKRKEMIRLYSVVRYTKGGRWGTFDSNRQMIP